MNEQDLELMKQIRLYIGKENWSLARHKTTDKEKTLLKSLSFDITKSCFVFGKEDMLNKFRAFFLIRCACAKLRPTFSQYSMNEYASVLSSGVRDDFGLNIDIELLFLYKHRHVYEIGKSNDWLNETILSKVADRNRDKLVTVVLSETRMPILESSGEFQIINLAGVLYTEEKKKAIEQRMQNGVGATNQEYTDYSS